MRARHGGVAACLRGTSMESKREETGPQRGLTRDTLHKNELEGRPIRTWPARRAAHNAGHYQRLIAPSDWSSKAWRSPACSWSNRTRARCCNW